MKKRYLFKELAIGDKFQYNSNTYIKQSSRTALMLGPDKWFYFGMSDYCYIVYEDK